MNKKSKELFLDRDFISLGSIYNRLKLKYSEPDILNALSREILIPCSIFSKKLSSLETIAKYLVEDKGLSFSRIADLLNRNSKTIWQAYKSAVKKHPSKFVIKESRYFFPVWILRERKFSVLENIVVYLRDELKLSNKEVADLLKRNIKTTWTCYNRAEKKRSKQKKKK